MSEQERLLPQHPGKSANRRCRNNPWSVLFFCRFGSIKITYWSPKASLPSKSRKLQGSLIQADVMTQIESVGSKKWKTLSNMWSYQPSDPGPKSRGGLHRLVRQHEIQEEWDRCRYGTLHVQNRPAGKWQLPCAIGWDAPGNWSMVSIPMVTRRTWKIWSEP